MSGQEVRVHPLNVRPGDVVLSVRSDVEITVRRELADNLPTKPGSIGYATAHGVTGIFAVRTDEAGPGRLPWFIPVPVDIEGVDVRWLRDDEISDFCPLAARTEVTRTQVMGALDTAFKATGNTGWGQWLEPGTKAVLDLLGGAA